MEDPLFQSLKPLDSRDLLQMMPKSLQLGHLSSVRLVPISSVEIWKLSSVGPIIFRQAADVFEPCLLLPYSLPMWQDRIDDLPDVVCAYPFAALPRADDPDQLIVMIDHPDESDVQSDRIPVYQASGDFSPESLIRINALLRFTSARAQTRRLTQILADQRLLRPLAADMILDGAPNTLIAALRVPERWFDLLLRRGISPEDLQALTELVEAHLISLRHPDLRFHSGARL